MRWLARRDLETLRLVTSHQRRTVPTAGGILLFGGDLLPQVQAAFAEYKMADKAGFERELAKAIEHAEALGADTETLPTVKDLRSQARQ